MKRKVILKEEKAVKPGHSGVGLAYPRNMRKERELLRCPKYSTGVKNEAFHIDSQIPEGAVSVGGGGG